MKKMSVKMGQLQLHSLMAGIGFLTIRLNANLRWIDAYLTGDILNIRMVELPGKEFAPCLEVACHH